MTKDWKRLVLQADATEVKKFKYNKPRRCLMCDNTFLDSADMFVHIKMAHIKK